MIIRDRPSVWRLFFVVRGSVVLRVVPQILSTFVIAVIVTFFHDRLVEMRLTLTPVPFSLIGLALAIFLGFKNSTSYERYWESRKMWGELIVSSRCFARQVKTLLLTEDAALQNRMIRKTIAFSYALKSQLRTEASDLRPFLADGDFQLIGKSTNPANALLESLGGDLRMLLRARQIGEPLAQAMDDTLNTMSRVLGGCERIKSTPIPFSYTVLLHRTAYLYCFALPFGLVDTVGVMMPVVVLWFRILFLRSKLSAPSLKSLSACRPMICH